MEQKRKKQGLIFISLMLASLVNYPFLKIFNQPASVKGIPLLYGYLFGIWALLVVALWLFVRWGRQ